MNGDWPTMFEFRVMGLDGIPEVRKGDDLGEVIMRAARRAGVEISNGDIVIVTQKVVSKAEGRVVTLDSVEPSSFSRRIATLLQKDPRLVEVILKDTRRIVKMARGVVITETRQGLVCANAGVDQSNVGKGHVSMLPVDPDKSASGIREKIRRTTGAKVGVIISDTFGRPWREGHVDFAIGVAGIQPILDYRGKKDRFGYELRVTTIAIADELAAAAELAMGKLKQIPVVIVKGYHAPMGEGSARELARKPSRDLFR